MRRNLLVGLTVASAGTIAAALATNRGRALFRAVTAEAAILSQVFSVGAVDQHTFMGGYIELQPDSFEGGKSTPATDGDTAKWGFPHSLVPSEQARLRDALLPGGGKGIRYIRLPLGFAYRGFRNIDPDSGLARNIGERYAGQNSSIASLLANVIGDGGGLAPEYWSPAPHWKTTSAYGKGTLWAGAGYARSVTLDSIKTSDFTQYAAQIDAFTDAVVNDLEYLHQNVGPIRMFGLQNEPVTIIQENYGTCSYEETTLLETLKALMPKIRASSVLSIHRGRPNSVLIHYNSWKGLDPNDVGGSILNDTMVLATGKTALQEIWASTSHYIPEIAGDADFIKSNAETWKGYAPDKPRFTNEFEYFTPHDSTSEWRCANTMLQMVLNFALMDAPVLMPIIHMVKPIGQTSLTSNTEGYGLVRTRLPMPYSQAPTTPGDEFPSLNCGFFDPVPANWNAAMLVFENLLAGSKRLHVDGGMPEGVGLAAFKAPSGKRGVLIVNRNETAFSATFDLPGNWRGRRYSVHYAGTALDVLSAEKLILTVPAYSGEAWVEE